MIDDPHAVRARTHRAHDPAGYPVCKRCGKPSPCPKDGQTDPEPRWRWAILAGAIVGLWCVCMCFVGWLAGWWL
jgi:hypothetical protein